MKVSFTLNGESVAWEATPGEILLDALRARGLVGTRRGCPTSDCGVCTVLVDGRARKSCITFVAALEGRAVTTIEGVGAHDAPHPVQRAFAETGAVQCGFCTPGMVMASLDLLARAPDPTEAETRAALDGNLCRCTGYVKIFEAVRLAADRMREGGGR